VVRCAVANSLPAQVAERLSDTLRVVESYIVAPSAIVGACFPVVSM